MNRKKLPVSNIGTALILTVFIILALISFAALSMVSANHNYQAAQKTADRTASYYEASGDAEIRLAEIDDILAASYSAEKETYYENVKDGLQALPDITLDFDSDTPAVSYRIPVSDSHALLVQILIMHPASGVDGFYELKTWQEISTKEWNGDATLNLMP